MHLAAKFRREPFLHNFVKRSDEKRYSQAVWACTLSTPEQFALHSMHCYFLASVSKKAPLHYKVTRLRDGRGFCVRNVVGIQNGKNVIAVSASFQVPESSPVEVDNFPRLPVAAASTSEPTFGSTDAVLRPQARDVSLKPTGFRFGGVELRSAVLTDNGKTHDDAVYTWIRVARTDNRGRAMQKVSSTPNRFLGCNLIFSLVHLDLPWRCRLPSVSQFNKITSVS